MGFDGMRVLSLESRRAAEMETLIRKQGGDPFVAPSMREAPLERNDGVFVTCERLFAGEFDMMICLTGVGMRALDTLRATRYPEQRFREALRGLRVVARGPKPAAALREMQVPVDTIAPEPNTWREVMGALGARLPLKVAVQEYGRRNPELIAALEKRGAAVTAIPIYKWRLPEGLARTVISSVGPSTTEMLVAEGIAVDIEPSRPKMGFLIKETAERAVEAARLKQVNR